MKSRNSVGRPGDELQFSQMEARQLLAGDVTASYSNGDLKLFGTPEANQVRLYQTSTGTVRVVGLDRTTVNGQRMVEFPMIADDLSIFMAQGGNDNVTISGRFNVPDDLAANTNGGEILLDGTRGQINVAGDVRLDAGSAGQAKLLNEVRIHGDLSIDAGGESQMVAGQARRVTFSPSNFNQGLKIDNPLFPLIPLTRYEYEAIETDPTTGKTSVETVVVEVTDRTRRVGGVEAREVHDRVWKDGRVVEDTLDWYAQDNSGNVWYLGELATNFEYDQAGNLIGTNDDGSWETGAAGALPGIQMAATPHVGDRYYQEFRPQIAIDQGDVLSVNETLATPLGTKSNVLKTRDWTVLEPSSIEHKYFAPGLGSIRTEKLDYQTGKVKITVNLVRVTLDGVPVTSVTNPANFSGSSQIGKGTGFIRVAGETTIRNSQSVFVDGARFMGTVNLKAQDELGIRDTYFSNSFTGRSNGQLSLQNALGNSAIYLSGDSDVNIRNSQLRDEFELNLGASANRVVISESSLFELQIDGGGGENRLELDPGTSVGELDLTRIRLG